MRSVNRVGRTADRTNMKSAFELAMERLQKQAPSKTLTAAQKAELADLETLYRSKIAQVEIEIGDEIQSAEAQEDFTRVDALRQRLQDQKAKLEEEREDRKERVRRG